MGDIGVLWVRRRKAGASLEVQQLRLNASPAGGMGLTSGQGTKIPHVTCVAKKGGCEREVLDSTEFSARSHFPSSLIQPWSPPQLHLHQTADLCLQTAFHFLLPKTNPRNKVWFGSLTITCLSVWINKHEPFLNSRRKPLPKGKAFLFPSQVRTAHPVKQSAPRKWLW